MQSSLSKQEVRDKVRKLAPFHHRVDLPYGLSTYVSDLSRRSIEYTRVESLVRHAFPALLKACGGSLQGKKVLDIACNCGGFSVEASRMGSEYVLGIDIVDHYIKQANFIKNAIRLDNVDFEIMDLEDLNEDKVGKFDVVLCFGILYHLEDPVNAMRRIASVTKDIMLVDTRVMSVPFYARPFFRNPTWSMHFPGVATQEHKNASTSLWRSEERRVEFRPNQAAVVDLMKYLGFARVDKIEPVEKGLEKRYYNGRRVSFLATRT